MPRIPYAVSNAKSKIYSSSHFRLHALSLKACKHQSKFIALAANFGVRRAGARDDEAWADADGLEKQVFTIAARCAACFTIKL